MGMLLPAFRILIVLSMPSGPWLVLSRFSLKKADLFHDVFLPFVPEGMYLCLNLSGGKDAHGHPSVLGVRVVGGEELPGGGEYLRAIRCICGKSLRGKAGKLCLVCASILKLWSSTCGFPSGHSIPSPPAGYPRTGTARSDAPGPHTGSHRHSLLPCSPGQERALP